MSEQARSAVEHKREYNKRYRAANKERLAKRDAAYREANKERLNAYTRAYRRSEHGKKVNAAYKKRRGPMDAKLRMLYNARDRARKRGIECTISVDDIVIPEKCPILGTPLKVGSGRVSGDSPSLDRIDPTVGYVPENVAVISHRANNFKRDFSIADVRSLLRYMVSHAEKKRRDAEAKKEAEAANG